MTVHKVHYQNGTIAGILPLPCNRPLLSARVALTRADFQQLGDNELVQLTLKGQNRAYEELVRRYQKLVYNVIYQMLQSHDSAADITQETFLKAYKALSSFRAEARFKPWLLRIASNTGLNRIRDGKHRDHQSLDGLLEENSAAEPASQQDVESEVEWRLSHIMLLDALRQLPARHRHTFLLRYQHDMSYAEIAMITDETETAVKALLFRTRERLRKLLEVQMLNTADERASSRKERDG